MKKYYASLDLYRFLAALAVAFFFHYRIVLGAIPYEEINVVDFLCKYGGYVVEMFFVISGFVICNAALCKIQDKRIGFGSFMIGRIVRIYPTLVVTVIVAALGMWIGYAVFDEALIKDSSVSLLAFVLNILGLNGGLIIESPFVSVNGPSWYVSVLMVCYVLFYFIVRLSRDSKAYRFMCYIAVILIGIFAYLNVLNLPFLSVSCARGYIYFFLGTMLGEIQDKASRKGRVIICIISLLLIIMFVFTKYYGLLYKESLEIGLFVVTPLVIFGINCSPLNRICDCKVVKKLGSISYGIFMWNIPVFIWTRFVEKAAGIEFEYGGLFAYLVIVAVNILIGALSYVLIEGKLSGVLRSRW